jgi:hypothetical protein
LTFRDQIVHVSSSLPRFLATVIRSGSIKAVEMDKFEALHSLAIAAPAPFDQLLQVSSLTTSRLNNNYRDRHLVASNTVAGHRWGSQSQNHEAKGKCCGTKPYTQLQPDSELLHQYQRLRYRPRLSRHDSSCFSSCVLHIHLNETLSAICPMRE